MATITTPIWKDCYVTLGNDPSIPFRIRANDPAGDVIYSGLCSARPGESDCVVRINDIAADYLTHTLPTLGTAAFSLLTFPVRFYVETWDGADWGFLTDDYAFIMDWSYVDGPLRYMLSSPLTGVVSPSQFVLVTVYDSADVTAVFTYSDGTTETHVIDLSTSDDFNVDFNVDFARSLRSAASGTAAFLVEDYLRAGKDLVSIVVTDSHGDSITYEVRNGCDDRYALYYLNAFGGWDGLLCTGIANRTDGIGRNTTEMEYDNRGEENRGKKDYALDITRRYTFRTGLLDDYAAAGMWHLLESTDVYVHDLQDGTIRPLVLTGSECAHLSFRNNGGRMPQYTIEAEVAQSFERR